MIRIQLQLLSALEFHVDFAVYILFALISIIAADVDAAIIFVDLIPAFDLYALGRDVTSTLDCILLDESVEPLHEFGLRLLRDGVGDGDAVALRHQGHPLAFLEAIAKRGEVQAVRRVVLTDPASFQRVG